MAAQECDCDFISSGHTVVDGPIIQWYEQTYVREPLERRGFDANYWIWEYPNYSKTYTVVADVARGDGADYSAFHVIDIENMVQCAEYRGKIGTTEYGNMPFEITPYPMLSDHPLAADPTFAELVSSRSPFRASLA
jgi:hypothetical protein